METKIIHAQPEDMSQHLLVVRVGPGWILRLPPPDLALADANPTKTQVVRCGVEGIRERLL
jgi:hypothetical protein